VAQRIFLPATAFAALLSCRRVWGLDYPFTVSRIGSRVSVLPVQFYTFPAANLMLFGRAWRAVAMS
jgi:hypothetical protein